MASTVVRVSTGDTVHVRTGVLAGVGPIGPPGPVGPQGEAIVGPQGPEGPTGYVSEASTELRGPVAVQTLATATSALVDLSTVITDENSAAVTATNVKPGVGSFYVSATVGFRKTTGTHSGVRSLLLTAGSLTAVGQNVYITGVTGAHTCWVHVATGVKITNADDIITVVAEHTDAASLQLIGVRFWLNRTGPGPKGDTGPQGLPGVAGPVGPQGEKGDPGTVVAHGTTFEDLRGA